MPHRIFSYTIFSIKTVAYIYTSAMAFDHVHGPDGKDYKGLTQNVEKLERYLSQLHEKIKA